MAVLVYQVFLSVGNVAEDSKYYVPRTCSQCRIQQKACHIHFGQSGRYGYQLTYAGNQSSYER